MLAKSDTLVSKATKVSQLVVANSENTVDIDDLLAKFKIYKASNALTVKQRLKLASNSSTSPEVLSLLAFDNGHVKSSGDIRIAVASNPSTPPEILRMISLNSDRLDWTWDEWLDYENDDWSDDVEYPAEYGNDIAQDVIAISKTQALSNPNFPK